jgi:hypothetical protein
MLDRLAGTPAVYPSEFFVEPAKGAAPPRPLSSGRRPLIRHSSAHRRAARFPRR